MLEFGNAAPLEIGVGLVIGPVADRLRSGQCLGQRHFAHQRFEAPIAIIENLLFGKERAELHDGGRHDPVEGRIGRHGHHRKAQHHQDQHANAQAAGNGLS
ncbi:hypothetical protein D3C72_2008080 [compost metagenome]